MIGKLTGIIDGAGSGHLILDVQGVGYTVQASARTLARIGRNGERASLLIETQVREDAITLFGFADAAEQQWFRLLTSVQGVGARVALSLLSACPPERLQLAIAAQDKAMLTQADGVGPKLALRILTELKDKAGKISLTPTLSQGERGPDNPLPLGRGEGEGEADHAQDAVSALVNLGYARSDAYQAVLSASTRANDNLQTLIREALKELSA